MAEITFPVTEATRAVHLKVRLTGTRRLAFRMWLGSKLIHLAGWVIGVGRCEVSIGQIDQ